MIGKAGGADGAGRLQPDLVERGREHVRGEVVAGAVEALGPGDGGLAAGRERLHAEAQLLGQRPVQPTDLRHQTDDATIVRGLVQGTKRRPQLAPPAGLQPGDRVVQVGEGRGVPAALVDLGATAHEGRRVVEVLGRGQQVRVGPHRVAAVDVARRVDVFGVGASSLAATDLHQKLTRIGRTALVWTDPHMAWTSATTLDATALACALNAASSLARNWRRFSSANGLATATGRCWYSSR